MSSTKECWPSSLGSGHASGRVGEREEARWARVCMASRAQRVALVVGKYILPVASYSTDGTNRRGGQKMRTIS
jgi:hypothetical protein